MARKMITTEEREAELARIIAESHAQYPGGVVAHVKEHWVWYVFAVCLVMWVVMPVIFVVWGLKTLFGLSLLEYAGIGLVCFVILPAEYTRNYWR